MPQGRFSPADLDAPAETGRFSLDDVDAAEPVTTAAAPAVRPAPIQVDRQFTSDVKVSGPANTFPPRIGAAPPAVAPAAEPPGPTALDLTSEVPPTPWRDVARVPVIGGPLRGIPQILRGARDAAMALITPPAGGPEPTLEQIQQQTQSDIPPTVLPERAKAGISDVIEGVFQTAEPLVAAAVLSQPVTAAIALGVATTASKAAHAAVKAAGGTDESARLAGNVVAAAVAGGATDILVRGARAKLSSVAADARAVREQAAAHDAAYDAANPPPPTEPIPVGRGATDAAIAAKPQLETVNDVLPPSPEPGAPPPPPPPMDTTAAVLDLVRAEPNSPEALTAIAGLRKAGWTDAMITAAVQQARPAPAVQMPVASARVAPDAPPPAAGPTPAPPAASDDRHPRAGHPERLRRRRERPARESGDGRAGQDRRGPGAAGDGRPGADEGGTSIASTRAPNCCTTSTPAS
jgi:hypothetical protein